MATVNPIDDPNGAAAKDYNWLQDLKNPGFIGTTYASNQLPNTLEPGDPQYNAAQANFEKNTDWGKIENQLKSAAAQKGVAYDPSDLAGILRNAGYDQAHLGDSNRYNAAILQFYNNALENYDQRANNKNDAGHSNDGGSGGAADWASRWGGYEGGTFSDPWTKQLEDLIKQQLDATTNPGAGSPQQLLDGFLRQRFAELSGQPGYSTADQAILNTQALEPIEAQRQASQQRALERAAARGVLPSSGVVQGEQAANDRFYDQQRTVANRDLAVNAITKRQNDLNQALATIQALSANEKGQMGQALNLSTLLRQLPIDAQNQALNVINGTGSPSQLFGQVSTLTAQQQALQQQQTQNYWQMIGQLLNGFAG